MMTIGVLFPASFVHTGDPMQRLATIEGGQWASQNQDLVALLNAEISLDGYDGHDPDLETAQRAVALHGGRLMQPLTEPVKEIRPEDDES